MEWYDWQKKIIEHQGDISIRGGRQTGKSEATAERIIKNANDTPNGVSLITSPSERQEDYLYEKVKRNLGDRYKYKRKPTLKRLILKNGHTIWKLPVGRTGIYVEGLSSVDFVYVDEAINMTERALDAILPMLAEPRRRGKGWITLLSNTRGRPSGYFYDSFKNPAFENVWISSENCPHISKEFLEQEKIRLGESRYKMIWCGEFVEIDYKLFKPELITQAMIIKEWKLASNYNPSLKYFIGVDPARFGKDKAGIAIAEMINKEKIKIIYTDLIKKCSVVDLVNIIKGLDSRFHFSKLFIDGVGVGGGVVDLLTEEYHGRVRELNNNQKGKEAKVLKEDLYNNLITLLETRRIEIIYDPMIKIALESVEYDGEEFFGKETDLVEAIIRACWSVKEGGYEPKII